MTSARELMIEEAAKAIANYEGSAIINQRCRDVAEVAINAALPKPITQNELETSENNWGKLKVQVNPGSAALFLAAEDVKSLSRIAKLPYSKVDTVDQTFWLKHPLTELAMAPGGTDHLGRVENWLRTLARDWPVSVQPTPRGPNDFPSAS